MCRHKADQRSDLWRLIKGIVTGALVGVVLAAIAGVAAYLFFSGSFTR